jgi:hypothetical protein
VSQGAYRILRSEGDLVETFVEAPGPAGWRWFGRVRDPATGEEAYIVDHVVDAAWRLVRFRLLDRDAGEVRAEMAPGGLVVTSSDATETVPEAEIVWSPSPASLLILDRLLRSTGSAEVRGTQVSTMGTWEPVTLAVDHTTNLRVNGAPHSITWAGELPGRVDGWFELLPEGHPLRP